MHGEATVFIHPREAPIFKNIIQYHHSAGHQLVLRAMEAIYHDPEECLIINFSGWGKGRSLFGWMEIMGVAPWPVAG